MKNIRKQANITGYMQIAPNTLPKFRPSFPKLSIVTKPYIFLTKQLARRW